MRERRLLLILFAIALLPRLLFLFETTRSPLFNFLYLDAKSYDSWGTEIASGKLSGGAPFHMAPLYPYLLGILYWVFGHNLLIVHVLQHLAGALSSVLVFTIARRLFGKTTAVLAYALALGYGPFLYFEGQVLSSWLGVLLGLLSLRALLVALEQEGRGLFGAGVLLGIGSVARPNLLFFLPLVIGWVYLRERGARRRLLLYAGGFALALVPTTVYNYRLSGDVIPISSHGGVSFYLGNNPYTTGTYVPPPEFGGTPEAIDLYDSRRLAEAEAARSLTASEISSFWYRKSFAFIREDPLRFARLLFRKTALYFNADEIPLDVNYTFDRRLYPILRWAPFSFGLLLSLAIVGSALLLRRGESRGFERGRLLVLFVLANAASVIVFFVCARYRQTAVPAVAILAAVAAARIAELARAQRWRPLAALLAVIAIVAVPVHLDLYRGRETSAVRSRIVLGRAFAASGDRARAEECFREALSDAPANTDAAMNLGLLLYDARRYPDAAQVFADAARSAPGFAGAWNNLGNALRESGALDEAVRAIRKAIGADSTYAGAYNNLGYTLFAAGRGEEAEAAYRRAIRLDPVSVLSWANLADLQFTTGDFLGAVETMRGAAEKQPSSAAIRWKREQIESAAALCLAAREAAGRADFDAAGRALREAASHQGAPVRAWAEREPLLAPLLHALSSPEGTAGGKGTP